MYDGLVRDQNVNDFDGSQSCVCVRFSENLHQKMDKNEEFGLTNTHAYFRHFFVHFFKVNTIERMRV